MIADSALGLADSASMQILGVELSKDSRLALVERAEIKKIIAEKVVQQSLTAQGVEARRRLGTLLKARLLLMLRAGDRRNADGTTVRYLDVAIADTAQGLRLTQEQLPWDDAHPEALVVRVRARLDLALAVMGEPSKAIIAVAPFHSDDLAHRFDAMQDAYARMLIETFIHVQGLRVVELAEAEAIAQEIRLSGGEKIGREFQPFYLTGRYRNEGQETSRTVNLSLELRRDGGSIAQLKASGLSPAGAAAFLRESAQRLIGRVIKDGRVEFKPEAERAELTRQARQFQELGEWEKALALTETALLLMPDDPELHLNAMTLYGQSADAMTRGIRVEKEAIVPPALKAIDMCERGCDHLRLYVQLADIGDLAKSPAWVERFQSRLEDFWKSGLGAYFRQKEFSELKMPVSDLGRIKRDTILSIYDSLADRKMLNYATCDLFYECMDDSFPAGSMGIGGEDAPEILEPLDGYYGARLRAVRACLKGDYMDGCEKFADPHTTDTLAYRAFLSQVGALPSEELKLRVRKMELCNWNIPGHIGHTVTDSVVTKNPDGSETITQTPRVVLPDDKERRLEEMRQLIQEVDASSLNPERKANLKHSLDYSMGLLEGKKEPTRKPWAPVPSPTPAEVAVIAGPRGKVTWVRIPDIDVETEGWIACGPGLDVLWDGFTVYRIRAKGAPEVLFRDTDMVPSESKGAGANRAEGFAVEASASYLKDMNCVWDGKFVWVWCKDHVAVIDPETRVVHRITEEEGLIPGMIEVAPLGPGRVCLVGSFGRKATVIGHWESPRGESTALDTERGAGVERTWCAIAEHEGGKTKLKIVFDAKLQKGERDDPHVAFTPRFAFAAYDPRGDSLPRVLVGRELPDEKYSRPILINLADGSAQVLDLLFEREGSEIVEHDGALFWMAQNWVSSSSGAFRRQTILYRLAAPNFEVEQFHNNLAVEEEPSGALGFIGNNCLLFATGSWWVVDEKGGRMTSLGGSRMGKCYPSSNYGFVSFTEVRGRNGLNRSICWGMRLGMDIARVAEESSRGQGGREVRETDPWEGSRVILRKYADSGSGETYTTLSAPVLSKLLIRVPRREVSGNTQLAIVAEDQTNPLLREFYQNEGSWNTHGGGRNGPSNEDWVLYWMKPTRTPYSHAASGSRDRMKGPSRASLAAMFAGDATTESLLKKMGDPDSQICRSALDSLGLVGNASMAPQIMEARAARKEKDPMVTLAFDRALARLGVRKATPLLTEELDKHLATVNSRDREMMVGQYIQLLGGVGDPSALSVLQRALAYLKRSPEANANLIRQAEWAIKSSPSANASPVEASGTPPESLGTKTLTDQEGTEIYNRISAHVYHLDTRVRTLRAEFVPHFTRRAPSRPIAASNAVAANDDPPVGAFDGMYVTLRDAGLSDATKAVLYYQTSGFPNPVPPSETTRWPAVVILYDSKGREIPLHTAARGALGRSLLSLIGIGGNGSFDLPPSDQREVFWRADSSTNPSTLYRITKPEIDVLPWVAKRITYTSDFRPLSVNYMMYPSRPPWISEDESQVFARLGSSEFAALEKSGGGSYVVHYEWKQGPAGWYPASIRTASSAPAGPATSRPSGIVFDHFDINAPIPEGVLEWGATEKPNMNFSSADAAIHTLLECIRVGRQDLVEECLTSPSDEPRAPRGQPNLFAYWFDAIPGLREKLRVSEEHREGPDWRYSIVIPNYQQGWGYNTVPLLVRNMGNSWRIECSPKQIFPPLY